MKQGFKMSKFSIFRTIFWGGLIRILIILRSGRCVYDYIPITCSVTEQHVQQFGQFVLGLVIKYITNLAGQVLYKNLKT